MSDRSGSPDDASACPIASDSGPRRARRLRTWTLADGDGEFAVTVPHTWNAEDATDGTPGYERGSKRYRTEVEPANEANRRRFLHFEGAGQVATVAVDGDRVGRHEGGYTAFTYDVTDALRADTASTIDVTVDNTENPSVPPLSGDFTIYGGLYRPVWLVETGDVHVVATDHGSSGVFVDTPTVSSESATVRARTAVVNHRDEAVPVAVTHRVVDELGKVVTTFGDTETVPPDGERDFESTSTLGEAPRRWSPDDPYRYTLETEVVADGSVLDRVDCRFGIRRIDVGPDGRVRLNGEPIELRGTCRHQDRAGKGAALSNEDHVADVERIAETGANFLRLAHYPQSRTVLDAADREGLVLWEEVPVVDCVEDSAAFVENCRTMVREMVRQHYNHPSVGMWGFMNEILMKTDPDDPEELDPVLRLASDLDELLSAEDSTRPTAMACHFVDGYEDVGLTDVPDVLGWNMYVGWYDEGIEDVSRVFDETFDGESDRAEMVSEYGAGADVRLHAESPEPWDFTEEFQCRLHERHVAAFDERSEIAGTAQWNAFDFSTPVRADTIPDINQKGLATFDRRPKAVYHLYRAWLSDDPVVHVATRNWDRRVGRGSAADDSHTITVYANLPAVELVADGRSLGERIPDDGYAARWTTSLEPGETELVARGRTTDGTVVEDRTTVELVRFDVVSAGTVPDQGLAIDIGSHRDVVTAERVWAADRTYAAGECGWGHVEGTRESSLSRVSGTDLHPLYQDRVEGLESYRLDVPRGEYRVELHLCEMVHEDPGQRAFDVAVNGEPVVEGFDLVDAAGPREAVTLDATVAIGGDEPIRIDFEAVTGETLLNALLVEER